MKSPLPIFKTAWQAYKLVFQQPLYALRISWHWFVLLTMVMFLLAFAVGSGTDALLGLMAGNQTAAPTNNFDSHFVLIFGLALLVFLLYAVAWSSIAVLWHRCVLRKKMRGGVPVELSGRMVAYLLRFIIITVITVLAYIPFLIILGGIAQDSQADDVARNFILVTFLASLISGQIFLRLGAALPAVAVGNRAFGIIAAWRATRGDGLQIMLIFALTILPFWVLDFLMSFVIENGLMPGWLMGSAFVYTFELVKLLFMTLVGVTLLSLVYAHLAENKPIGSFPNGPAQ